MDDSSSSLPQKRYYRQRAHSNPISDHCFDYPLCPQKMDWEKYYPEFAKDGRSSTVEFADIGCGYGGLLIALSSKFPNHLSLGMEIRVKVADYVIDRIKGLRNKEPGRYNNIACIRSNAMKHLPNFFRKGQLQKMFFLFPDPHFKKSKHKWRIINDTLLAEYAYVLAVGGRIYTVTDVEDLFLWMTRKLDDHPLFQRLSDRDQQDDEVVDLLFESTEEGQKVTRNKGSKWCAVYSRVEDKQLC